MANPFQVTRAARLVANQFQPRPFRPDRGLAVVAGQHPDRVLEVEQPDERLGHRPGVAAGQVRPAPGAGEQRVAAEQQAVIRR